jgi:micrococcal nuclease
MSRDARKIALVAITMALVAGDGAAGRAASEISGTARVLDGNSLAIGTTVVRLFGIAAPDLSLFGGYTSMQRLAQLVAGNTVECQSTGLSVRGSVIGRCRAGRRDLSAALVADGFARDCPRQSGGAYAALERQAAAGPATDFDLPEECLADF